MFSEYRDRDLSVLTFNVTWYCPVRCSFCYITTKVSHEDKEILSKKDLIRECTIGRKYGVKEYRFSGGEPITIGDRLFEYADIVFGITGQKPVLLTSGIGINDRWLKKARCKFSVIAVSVENPLEPIQTVVDCHRTLEIIRENVSEDLPFRYGLTLVTAPHFKDIETIFDMLYDNVDKQFMPQLDYPCLKNFVNPTRDELHDIYVSTKVLFRKYRVVPYYFVYLVGSLVWLSRDALRIVLNLYPDGKYEIYDSMLECWQAQYKWQYYALKQQSISRSCRKCDWTDSCRHHPEGHLRYDWCNLRRAIFEGMYDGLGVDIKEDADHRKP